MNHLFYVRDYLIDTVDFLNVENCDIDSLLVFDYTSMNSDNNPFCVVISHTFSDEAGQSGDSANVIFDWRVLINMFCLLEGSREDNAIQIQMAYRGARAIIDALGADFSLGGKVMDGSIHSVLTPMTYSRNERDEYIMIGIVMKIKEALNG